MILNTIITFPFQIPESFCFFFIRRIKILYSDSFPPGYTFCWPRRHKSCMHIGGFNRLKPQCGWRLATHWSVACNTVSMHEKNPYHGLCVSRITDEVCGIGPALLIRGFMKHSQSSQCLTKVHYFTYLH